MKKITCAVLIAVLSAINLFAQSLFNNFESAFPKLKTSEQVEGEKRYAKAFEINKKAASKEADPLSNNAAAYSAMLRFIAGSKSENEKQLTYRYLDLIGVKNRADQDKLFEAAEFYKVESNKIQMASEQIIRQYHTPGSQDHFPLSDVDRKRLDKFYKDKDKLLKQVAKELKQKLSDQAKEGFHNHSDWVKRQLVFTKSEAVESDDLSKTRGASAELVMEPGDLPPGGSYISYAYSEGWIYAIVGDYDFAFDLGEDEWAYSNSSYGIVVRGVTELNPSANIHGLNHSAAITNMSNNSIAASASEFVPWTGESNTFSITVSTSFEPTENPYDTQNGPYMAELVAVPMCPDGHATVGFPAITLGSSVMDYVYAGWQTGRNSYAFEHRYHSYMPDAIWCYTQCGTFLQQRRQWVAAYAQKGYVMRPAEHAAVTVPWGPLGCLRLYGGIGVSILGQRVIYAFQCFDVAITVGG